MPPRRGIPPLRDLVLDILETDYGDWMTAELIAARAADIRPGTNPESVRRAVERLLSDPPASIETRWDFTDGFHRKRLLRAPRRSYLEATA